MVLGIIRFLNQLLGWLRYDGVNGDKEVVPVLSPLSLKILSVSRLVDSLKFERLILVAHLLSLLL